ncbi:MAG: alpha/beta hydrolase [Gammaproteobacteria bacterium]|nr:alpha/beta hydrolase [Gammaproteobacteria bacterium]
MPTLNYGKVAIHYEIYGDGFPILLFAPGGMRSAISFWQGSEWNPIEDLSPSFMVIAMDQRNAGSSRAPVSAASGWSDYTKDHIALLDHLNIEKTHLLGGCIGGPYCLGVIQSAPERVCSAVLQQPIGEEDNRDLFYSMFDAWADAIKGDHPEASQLDWESFRANMFNQRFLYNTSRQFVKECQTPLLILMGSDPYHPESVSREIADLSPNAKLIEKWKNPSTDNTIEQVQSFLHAHTPTS